MDSQQGYIFSSATVLQTLTVRKKEKNKQTKNNKLLSAYLTLPLTLQLKQDVVLLVQ